MGDVVAWIALAISLFGLLSTRYKERKIRNSTELFNKGFKFWDNNDFGNAINYFNKSIEENPRNVAALKLKCKALSKLGKCEEALNCYELVIEQDPSSSEELHELRDKCNKEIKNHFNGFYGQLLTKAKENLKLFADNPYPDLPFVDIKIGEFNLSYLFDIKKDKGIVELSITSASLDAIKKIITSKEKIEKDFGSSLEWVLDNKNNRITVSKTTDITYDMSSWPRIQDSMIEDMSRLEKSVNLYLEQEGLKKN